METLTPNDASMAIQFLNKTPIQGAESEAHAYLKAKLAAIRDGRELPKPVNLQEVEGKVNAGD